jgi:hypothetical protein
MVLLVLNMDLSMVIHTHSCSLSVFLLALAPPQTTSSVHTRIMVACSESSEEEDWPEDRRAEMQQPSHSLEQKESPLLPETQPRSRCDADSAAGHPADNVTDDVSDQKPEENSNDLRETRGCVGHPPEFEAVVKAAAASLRRTQGPRGEARTAALLLAHAGQQTPPSSLCTEVKQRPPQEAAPAYIHIPDEEQVRPLRRISFCCDKPAKHRLPVGFFPQLLFGFQLDLSDTSFNNAQLWLPNGDKFGIRTI